VHYSRVLLDRRPNEQVLVHWENRHLLPLRDVLLTQPGSTKYSFERIRGPAIQSYGFLQYRQSGRRHHALLDDSVPGGSSDCWSFGLCWRCSSGCKCGEAFVCHFSCAVLDFTHWPSLAPRKRSLDAGRNLRDDDARPRLSRAVKVLA